MTMGYFIPTCFQTNGAQFYTRVNAHSNNKSELYYKKNRSNVVVEMNLGLLRILFCYVLTFGTFVWNFPHRHLLEIEFTSQKAFQFLWLFLSDALDKKALY